MCLFEGTDARVRPLMVKAVGVRLAPTRTAVEEGEKSTQRVTVPGDRYCCTLHEWQFVCTYSNEAESSSCVLRVLTVGGANYCYWREYVQIVRNRIAREHV